MLKYRIYILVCLSLVLPPSAYGANVYYYPSPTCVQPKVRGKDANRLKRELTQYIECMTDYFRGVDEDKQMIDSTARAAMYEYKAYIESLK